MFDGYLFDCFVQVLEEEHEERYGYLQASLLEQLMMHNSTPERILESMNSVGKEIKSVSSILVTAKSLVMPSISPKKSMNSIFNHSFLTK
jgi:hypothetical protein